MFYTTASLVEHERGLVKRDRNIIDLIGPGRHRWFDPFSRLRIEVFDTDRLIMDSERANLLIRNHPDLAEGHLVMVRPQADTLALVEVDGAPYTVVPHGGTRAFWTAMHDVRVETVALATADRIDVRKADRWAPVAGTAIVRTTIASGEAGLLFVDGELRERLEAGRHTFWAAGRSVRIDTVDLRETPVEVVAQEVLTRDRVSVRLNVTAFTRITDPALRALAVPDAEAHLYKRVQFAVREAVGGRTLDLLLRDRVEVDGELAVAVGERLAGTGVKLTDLRIKDVILPGEMRDMLNKVVEAEKAAEANLIRRREETAATRSLLNTARLMDDHPTLMGRKAENA